MVTISMVGDRIHLEVEGLDKLWALKSHIEFPVSHVTSVRADPIAARGWFHGLRLPGTNVPGVLTAGSFYWNGETVFYDVHNTDHTIVIELAHEHYKRLVVEVADPAGAVALISDALKRAPKA